MEFGSRRSRSINSCAFCTAQKKRKPPQKTTNKTNPDMARFKDIAERKKNANYFLKKFPLCISSHAQYQYLHVHTEFSQLGLILQKNTSVHSLDLQKRIFFSGEYCCRTEATQLPLSLRDAQRQIRFFLKHFFSPKNIFLQSLQECCHILHDSSKKLHIYFFPR